MTSLIKALKSPIECLPGEMVCIEKVAPFGDPISIKVSGYRLSLRLNEAETILVEDI